MEASNKLSNRDFANIELGNQLGKTIATITPEAQPISEIPNPVQTEQDASGSALNQVVNNYNVNVNLQGGGGSNLTKNETTNIIKNITERNNFTSTNDLKKNSQSNFEGSGNSQSANVNNQTNTILNNYLKNETTNSNNVNLNNSSNSSSLNVQTNQTNTVLPSMMNNVENVNNSYNSNSTTTQLANTTNQVLPSLMNSSDVNITTQGGDTQMNSDISVQNVSNNNDTFKIDGMADSDGSSILYNENNFVQTREENLTKLENNAANGVHTSHYTSNQENKFLTNSNNFHLDSNKTFNTNLLNNESTTNNSFITDESKSIKNSFSSQNIVNNNETNLETVSAMIREKSLKESKIAVQAQNERLENKNRKIKDQIQEDAGAMSSLDMMSDGKLSAQNMSQPVVSERGEYKGFQHFNPFPSTISMFYEKMNSPPVWRTVNS